MLGAGSHGVRAAEVVGLIAAYHGFAKNRGQVRIFAETFRNAAPSAVAGHVEHWRECPAYAYRRGFVGSHTGAFLHQCGIPGGCLSERNGVDGLETVYNVAGKYQRYAKTGVLDGLALQGVDGFRIHFVEQRAYTAGADRSGHLVGQADTGALVELTDFFVEGHLREQRFYFLVVVAGLCAVASVGT